jgi:hypothetical protein
VCKLMCWLLLYWQQLQQAPAQPWTSPLQQLSLRWGLRMKASYHLLAACSWSQTRLQHLSWTSKDLFHPTMTHSDKVLWMVRYTSGYDSKLCQGLLYK